MATDETKPGNKGRAASTAYAVSRVLFVPGLFRTTPELQVQAFNTADMVAGQDGEVEQ